MTAYNKQILINNSMLRSFVLFSLLFVVSCQTVTINPQGGTVKYSSLPDYKKSHHFFLFGLIGERNVNTAQICKGRRVKQMQTQQTFLNGLLSGLTLGIYTPRTSKVWCREAESGGEES